MSYGKICSPAMEKGSDVRILISSDLNGTLVHQHTMSDMIRLLDDDERFETASAVFNRQVSGEATMQEAFGTAGPLTQRLTLRQALEYVERKMTFADEFEQFIAFLHENHMPLVINSTGYSVTIHAIRELLKLHDVLHGQIGNVLHFSVRGILGVQVFSDIHQEGMNWTKSIEGMTRHYFESSTRGADDLLYDRVQATGKVTLGIIDEAAKATLLEEYVMVHFPSLSMEHVVHMGDTMGDSGGIIGVARQGGLGIAFNYNETLGRHLHDVMDAEPELRGRIHLVESKSKHASLANVVSVIRSHFSV